jgi:hypothetical protein
VIYLDSSAALAQLFAEDRRLPELAGEGVLVSSQLLGYEVWNRIHARGFTRPRADEVRALLARVNMMAFGIHPIAGLKAFSAVRTHP